MRAKNWLLFLLLAGALSGFATRAAALPAGVEQGASIEGITEYRLANGLRVLLFPDASKPTVTTNITYRVGSRHEQYGETGMAHLLEHLLFEGTAAHPDIDGEMQRRGIDNNATTWLDRTNYFAIFAADADTLEWVLGLEADRMVNSPLAQDALASEMTVVRNEMEAGENSAIGVLQARIEATAYLWHNYGHSTIGARSDVENMPIERLRAFYRRHYRPDNATLLVAGRFDPDAALAAIARAFAPVARPAAPLPGTYTREPVQDGEREVTVRRVGDQRWLGLAYHVPAGTHPDHAALEVLADVLGRSPTGRLHAGLVDAHLATRVGSSVYALAEPGLFQVLAGLPNEADAGAAERALLALVETPPAFTAGEIAEAQQRYAAADEQMLSDPAHLAMVLSEAIAAGDWRLHFARADRIAAVTPADVARVAAHYLQPSNRTLGRFVPTPEPRRAEIAEAPAVAAVVAGLRERAPMAAGETFDASPANIDGRIVRATLRNGTRLVLLPKDTRGDTVRLQLMFRFSDLDRAMHTAHVANFVGMMLMRGTAEHDRDALARRLDALQAMVGVDSDSQSVFVQAQTVRRHLPDVLALIAEMLQQPTFPAAEFEQLRSDGITVSAASLGDPEALADERLGRHFDRWPVGHPLRYTTLEEDIDAMRTMQLDAVRAFHHEHYGAGDGEIALVGDFDAAAVQQQLDALFGAWTRPHRYVRIDRPHRDTAPAAIRVRTPDKANAVLAMRADFAMSDADPDYPALLVADHVFGGDVLTSRLGTRVRQDEGLSYSIGSAFDAATLDRRASMSVYAIAAPANIARVEAAVRAELRRLIDAGISEDELRSAVDGMLKTRAVERGEDGALVETLMFDTYFGRTMAWHADLDARLRALTVEQVNAAVRRHYGALRYTTVAAGDFAEDES